MTDYSIPAACQTLATTARIMLSAGIVANASDALTHAATDMVADAKDARKRVGAFAATVSADNAELWVFHGSVASDVLDGSIVRPSVGNVRAYTLALI